MSELGIDPLIPTSLWLMLAVAAALMLTWYAATRPSGVDKGKWWFGTALWTLAMSAILIVLLNPTRSKALLPPAGKPVLTVLVDVSGSMTTDDGDNHETRFAAASKIARQFSGELAGTFDVRVRAFDRMSKLVSPDMTGIGATGSGSDIASAMSSSLTGDVAAGEAVVLLSDGIHNTGGGSARVLEAVHVAKAMNAPIYTRTFGGAAERADLGLTVKSPQEMTLVGQRLPVTAQVTNVGTSGRTAEVLLLQGGREVARKTAVLGVNGSADVHFSIAHEKVGVYPYELRVEPFPGEVTKTNNSATYVVRVVDEPIRVLVLEGKPYWDSKFFTRTLASDPAVALDCVVKLTEKRLMRRVLTHAQAEQSADGKTPPTRDESWELAGDAKAYLSSSEKLRGFQIVVLGRDAEAFVSDESVKVLQEWIARDGGALVCYRGTPTAASSPLLSKLMPVRWTASPANAKGNRFRMALTPRGEELDWFGSAGSAVDAEGKLVSVVGMPSLERTARVDSSKPLAVVLAATTDEGGEKQPVVVYQPYGAGRVVVVEGSGMWRWAFLPPAYREREKTYASLWHSLMRWLTSETSLRPGQQFLLRADKVRFTGSEQATVTLLAREGATSAGLPGVELTIEGGEPKTVSPAPAGEEAGVYRVNFGVLPEGRYAAHLAGTKADDASTNVMFDVRKLDQEMLDLSARPELMARIAADSGGAVLHADAVKEVQAAFTAYQARTRPPVIEKTSVWDRGWVLSVILGACAVLWVVRRTGGLV